jgi:hypothetical protein
VSPAGRPSRRFAQWFALWFALRYVLRFTPRPEPKPGLRLCDAGLRCLAFFDISICAGNFL